MHADTLVIASPLLTKIAARIIIHVHEVHASLVAMTLRSFEGGTCEIIELIPYIIIARYFQDNKFTWIDFEDLPNKN